MRSRLFWIVSFATIAVQMPAQAQDYRGTFEQQLACTPDVFRLCNSEIPDADRIVACLRQHTAQLGDSCKAVFEARNSAAKETARSNRAAH